MAKITAPATPPAPVPDARTAFKCATYFEFASKMLAMNMVWKLNTMNLGDTFELPTQIPTIVNSAFCAELYLKCLRIIEGNPSENTHDLEKIFGGLTQNHQASIRSYFKRAIDVYPTTSALRAMGCNEELFQFDYVIKKASNAFEDYRYYFEDPKRCKPYNGQFIYHAVRWVIVEERPQWQADVDVLDAQPTSPAR